MRAVLDLVGLVLSARRPAQVRQSVVEPGAIAVRGLMAVADALESLYTFEIAAGLLRNLPSSRG
jgi:hypothetical protein